MPGREITEAAVAYLLAAKKIIHRELQNNYSSRHEISEVRVAYEIRRKDSPGEPLSLRFYARLEKPSLSIGPKPTPGISLLWLNRRIRGVNRRVRHDVIRNGVSAGVVRGWYEHQWTNTDGDRYVVDVNGEIGKTDFWSLIQFCLERWGIEAPAEQLRFGGEP